MSEQDPDLHPSEYDEIPDESEQLDQIQPEDSLNDRGVDDILDEGVNSPERWSVLQRQDEHDTLDERLSEEEPDPTTAAENPAGYGEPLPDQQDDSEIDLESDFLDDGEVGDERSGRLVDPNEGTGEDQDSELVGTDVGIDGAAASAEEAAVHVVDEDEDRESGF